MEAYVIVGTLRPDILNVIGSSIKMIYNVRIWFDMRVHPYYHLMFVPLFVYGKRFYVIYSESKGTGNRPRYTSSRMPKKIPLPICYRVIERELGFDSRSVRKIRSRNSSEVWNREPHDSDAHSSTLRPSAGHTCMHTSVPFQCYCWYDLCYDQRFFVLRICGISIAHYHYQSLIITEYETP